MVKLSNNELSKINGGGLSIGVALLIGGLATFIIGMIDGYVRPLRCR